MQSTPKTCNARRMTIVQSSIRTLEYHTKRNITDIEIQ